MERYNCDLTMYQNFKKRMYVTYLKNLFFYTYIIIDIRCTCIYIIISVYIN